MIQISYQELEDTIVAVITDLPEQFSKLARQTIIDVQDMPDQQILDRLGIKNPQRLLGVYTGVPLPNRSVLHPGRLPDRIVLFKHNLQRTSVSANHLRANIRTTLLHELGHVMGLSDRELRKLGY